MSHLDKFCAVVEQGSSSQMLQCIHRAVETSASSLGPSAKSLMELASLTNLSATGWTFCPSCSQVHTFIEVLSPATEIRA